MQTLNVNYDYQVGDIGETSTLPKRGNERKNGKNGASLAWVELTTKRHEDAMLFCVFLFFV